MTQATVFNVWDPGANLQYLKNQLKEDFYMMLQSFSRSDVCPGVDFDINIKKVLALLSACVPTSGTFYSSPANLSPATRISVSCWEGTERNIPAL